MVFKDGASNVFKAVDCSSRHESYYTNSQTVLRSKRQYLIHLSMTLKYTLLILFKHTRLLQMVD